MEPISNLVMFGAGIAFSAFGMSKTMSAQNQYNTAQTSEIQSEEAVNDEKRKAMELDANRRKLENLRKAQQAGGLSLAASTNQGSQFGSGEAGGQAQIRGEEAWNALGVNQNLMIGRNIFNLDDKISQDKIAMANANIGIQEGQAWSSLGSNLMGGATSFGRLFSGPAKA